MCLVSKVLEKGSYWNARFCDVQREGRDILQVFVALPCKLLALIRMRPFLFGAAVQSS